ncbi:AI-2E family transporter [uncultured Dokdonia sp.]|uniref:AI-2E family transporter n=1 Tax=uncultured Dokdonia sp. TaxID=575653 RepID=UPI002615AEE5|nr:AI-2E family transporter [uncultured Dokdonia sp.]
MTIKTTPSNFAFNIIATIAVIFALYVLKPLIMPLLLAAIFGIMIFPVQSFLEKKWRCNRLFATIFSIIIMFGMSVLLVFFIATQLREFMDNGNEYISKITEIYTKIIGAIEKSLDVSRRDSLLGKEVGFSELLKGNFDKISAFIFQSGAIFSDFVLIPIYLFFFLYYRRFLRNFAYRLFSKNSNSSINLIIKEIYDIQQNYLVGLLKVMLIVGILNTTGLLLLGIENAVFFGFFAAFLLIIPYIGVLIGALLPGLVALVTKDSYWYVFGVFALFSFIQFIEGNFITPKITGEKVSVNSFIVIFSLIAFAMLWGVGGMVVAIPITATIKILCDHSENYKAFGFLIGEPENKFLRSTARSRLKKWKSIRKNR